MGSTSYLGKAKAAGFKANKSGSSVGSDKEMSGKLRRTKIRRPAKMNEYGMKRIPDYTELAYKEAVGKLRYFLSGNYSPSVRSYGGSVSIKNLDDPEETPKKYSPYVAEYPRRSKYASLYADSVRNSGHVPPPHTTDPASSTNPDVVQFIQKQEEYIEQLERESQYCRDELNTLLGKVKEVISENEQLHETQQQKLLSRMFQTYAAPGGSETDDLDDVGDSTGLDSDHKIKPSKLRRSSKPRGPKLEGSNIVFESRIAELEAQLTQAKIDLKKVQEENNDNKRKLASGLVDSTCLDGFKRQIDNLQRDKSTLESQISKLKLSLEQRPVEDGYKRNDSVEQSLREERNKLETELRRLKEDLSKERSRIRELCGDSARRGAAERTAAEQRYHQHFDELSHDLAAQYDNVAKLQLELERQRRDENDLKREISMKNAVIEELKMELKNKSSSLQADLSQAHAEKASLEEELASARLAIERNQRQAKHESNRMNSEIQSIRQRLDRADADLVHSRRENLRLTEQIAALEKELNMKNLTPLSPEKNKKEIEHAATIAQLEAMVQSQNSLMDKLTGECRGLTDKLDDANRRHKEELASLHRQVDLLGRSMQQTSTHDSYYQAPAPHTPTAHRPDDPAPPPTQGQFHPRPDPPAHTPTHDSRPPLPRQPSNNSLGHSRPQSRQLSRQPSKTSIKNDQINQPEVKRYDESEVKRYNEAEVKRYDEPEVKQQYEVPERDVANENQGQVYSESDQVVKDQGYKQPFEEEPKDYTPVTQGYQEPAYAQETTGYSQEADYAQVQEEPKYEGQANYDAADPNYREGFEQPTYGEQGYTQEQYQGNYDQQYVDPNTQYTDPNAQYADPNTQYADPNAQYADPNAEYTDPNAQYENYAADPNYDNQDYTANQVYTAPAQDVVPKVKATAQKDKIESKVTTSPKARVSNIKS